MKKEEKGIRQAILRTMIVVGLLAIGLTMAPTSSAAW